MVSTMFFYPWANYGSQSVIQPTSYVKDFIETFSPDYEYLNGKWKLRELNILLFKIKQKTTNSHNLNAIRKFRLPPPNHIESMINCRCRKGMEQRTRNPFRRVTISSLSFSSDIYWSNRSDWNWQTRIDRQILFYVLFHP